MPILKPRALSLLSKCERRPPGASLIISAFAMFDLAHRAWTVRKRVLPIPGTTVSALSRHALAYWCCQLVVGQPHAASDSFGSLYISRPRQSIILSNSAVPLRPLADAMPSSARCPRSALLNIGTLAHQRLSGPVQHQNGLLLRRLLIGTKRIDGRVTASQIAAASFASFLLRLR